MPGVSGNGRILFNKESATFQALDTSHRELNRMMRIIERLKGESSRLISVRRKRLPRDMCPDFLLASIAPPRQGIAPCALVNKRKDNPHPLTAASGEGAKRRYGNV